LELTSTKKNFDFVLIVSGGVAVTSYLELLVAVVRCYLTGFLLSQV